MKRALAATLATLALCTGAYRTCAAEHVDDAEQPAKVLAEQVCSVCHGPGGHSTYPATPNLAAQTRQYLVAKLKQFRNRAQGKPDSHIDILGLTLMDDSMTEALARYYATQKAAEPVPGDAALTATGSKIYARGVPEQNLPPCGICHGANATGLWIFPRLAGQHAEYVERQIGLIQEHLRDSPVMHGIIKSMTPEEIKAVAAFAQSK